MRPMHIGTAQPLMVAHACSYTCQYDELNQTHEHKLGDWRVRALESLQGMIAMYVEDTDRFPSPVEYGEMVRQALETCIR